MNLEKVPIIVCEGVGLVQADLNQLTDWENTAVTIDGVAAWANTDVSERWGKKAACRVFHICESGYDVAISDPFAKGEATDKPVERTRQVLWSILNQMLTPETGLGGPFDASSDIGVLGNRLWELRFALRENRIVPKPLDCTRLVGVEQVVANLLTRQVQPFPGQRTMRRIAGVEAGTAFGIVEFLEIIHGVFGDYS